MFKADMRRPRFPLHDKGLRCFLQPSLMARVGTIGANHDFDFDRLGIPRGGGCVPEKRPSRRIPRLFGC